MTNKSLSQSQVRGSVLFRQYYPEGGWGWVVVFVGALMIAFTQVNIFSHILHLDLRESICLLEFWWSQQSGDSGDSSSAAKLKKKTFCCRPSLVSYVTLSTFSMAVSRKWVCTMSLLMIFYIPGFCLCLWLPFASTNRPGSTLPSCPLLLDPGLLALTLFFVLFGHSVCEIHDVWRLKSSDSKTYTQKDSIQTPLLDV